MSGVDRALVAREPLVLSGVRVGPAASLWQVEGRAAPCGKQVQGK
jgi:hypothetical protein